MALFKSLPSTATARAQLGDAQAIEATAAADLKSAFVAGDDAQEAVARAKLNEARRAVERLEAVLIAASEREALRDTKARQASEKAQDAAVIDAYQLQAAAALAVQKAVKHYARHYAALIAAGDAARNLAAVNPRVRRDLQPPNASVLVSHEIARAGGQGPLSPPGAHWPTHSRDPCAVTPLSDHFQALAGAILP